MTKHTPGPWQRAKFNRNKPWPYEVDGWSCGLFAAYNNGYCWELIHVPTGYIIDSRYGAKRLKDVKAAADRLVQIPAPWASSDSKEIEAVPGIRDAVHVALGTNYRTGM